MAWKCTCLSDTLYYGNLCQYQTNKLKVKQALTRSFASIAIIALSLTCLFIVLMDILKYGFHIDPVQRERRRIQKQQEQQRQRREARLHPPKMALRFQYVA